MKNSILAFVVIFKVPEEKVIWSEAWNLRDIHIFLKFRVKKISLVDL